MPKRELGVPPFFMVCIKKMLLIFGGRKGRPFCAFLPLIFSFFFFFQRALLSSVVWVNLFFFLYPTNKGATHNGSSVGTYTVHSDFACFTPNRTFSRHSSAIIIKRCPLLQAPSHPLLASNRRLSWHPSTNLTYSSGFAELSWTFY